LLAAMLCAFAELVLNVASILGMIPSLLSRECHTDVEPPELPQRTCDQQETQPAAPDSQPTLDTRIACLAQPPCLSSRKREALSGTHWSTWGLADPAAERRVSPSGGFSHFFRPDFPHPAKSSGARVRLTP
jgi:hypothetical protein